MGKPELALTNATLMPYFLSFVILHESFLKVLYKFYQSGHVWMLSLTFIHNEKLCVPNILEEDSPLLSRENELKNATYPGCVDTS